MLPIDGVPALGSGATELSDVLTSGSAQAEHCHEGVVDTPKLLAAQVASEIAQPADVDGTD
ncbi:MAG: hypothetical protein ACRDZW_06650, partial [Acidimicrobiales bacterium]